jgi:hypothetical protein
MPLQVWDKAAFESNYRLFTGDLVKDSRGFNKPMVINYQRFRKRPSATGIANRLVTALGLVTTDNLLIVGAGFGWLKEAFDDDLSWVGNVICIDDGAYIQAEKGNTENADINEIFATKQNDYIVQSIIDDPSSVPGGAGKTVETIEYDEPNPGDITITFTDQFVVIILRTEYDAEITASGLDPTGGNGLTIFNKVEGDAGTKARVPIEDENLSNNGSRNRVRNLNGGVNYDWAISERVIESLDDAECLTLSANMHLVATNVAHIFEMFIPYKADPSEPNPWNWKWPDANVPLEPKWGQVDSSTSPHLEALPWYTETTWKDLIPGDTFVKVGNWRVF